MFLHWIEDRKQISNLPSLTEFDLRRSTLPAVWWYIVSKWSAVHLYQLQRAVICVSIYYHPNTSTAAFSCSHLLKECYHKLYQATLYQHCLCVFDLDFGLDLSIQLSHTEPQCKKKIPRKFKPGTSWHNSVKRKVVNCSVSDTLDSYFKTWNLKCEITWKLA